MVNLYVSDICAYGENIQRRKCGIITTALELGLTKLSDIHPDDHGIFGDLVDDIISELAGGKKSTIFSDRLITTRSDSTSDITLQTLNPGDLSSNFLNSSLYQSFEQCAIFVIRKNNNVLRLNKGVKRIEISSLFEPLIIIPKIIDYQIDYMITFNSTTFDYIPEIEKEFDLLVDLLNANIADTKYCPPKSLTNILCLTTKSDKVTLEWRIKRSYLRTLHANHDLVRNPVII